MAKNQIGLCRGLFKFYNSSAIISRLYLLFLGAKLEANGIRAGRINAVRLKKMHHKNSFSYKRNESEKAAKFQHRHLTLSDGDHQTKIMNMHAKGEACD